MPREGLAFGAGLAQGAASATELFFRHRLGIQEANNQARLIGIQRAQDATAGLKQDEARTAAERETAEINYGRGFQEQYGLPYGATTPLGPGEQGPTPAGPADVASAIQGTPSFQRKKQEEILATDQNIRQLQAQAAAQNVFTLADQIRLGADIQRAHGDGLAVVQSAVAADGGAALLEEYRRTSGNPNASLVDAMDGTAKRLAQPAVDQILNLVPPEFRTNIRGLEGTPVVTAEQIKTALRNVLEAPDADPVKVRANINKAKQEVARLGGTFSPEELAQIDAKLAAVDLAAEKARRPPLVSSGAFGLPQVEAGRIMERGATGAQAAVGGLLGRAAPVAPLLLRLSGGGRNRATRPTPSADQMQLQELQAREVDLLARAAGEVSAFGTTSMPTSQELNRVQMDIARLGGVPSVMPPAPVPQP